MTDSKRIRTVAFNITGSHEETGQKIQKILALIKSDDYHETEVSPKIRTRGWPLLNDKPEQLPKPARPTTVTICGDAVPVITPHSAAFFSAALGVCAIIYVIAGLSSIWYGLLAYLLAGIWVFCWVTNMQARWVLRDEERIRREITKAEIRDLDLANPDSLR